MTSKQFPPATLIAVAGATAIAILAILWSARAAAVISGVVLLGLALARSRMASPGFITARSARFDTLFLALLGVGILILATTAENI